MLRIQREILKSIFAHAKRDMPVEACGYLAGNNGTVTLHYEMENIDASSEHFSFNVQEQFSVVKDARSKGLKIMAVYHSHPAAPARPSEEDIKLAHDPDVSYVILSFAGNTEDIKSFRIKNGKVENEVLEVTDNAEI